MDSEPTLIDDVLYRDNCITKWLGREKKVNDVMEEKVELIKVMLGSNFDVMLSTPGFIEVLVEQVNNTLKQMLPTYTKHNTMKGSTCQSVPTY